MNKLGKRILSAVISAAMLVPAFSAPAGAAGSVKNWSLGINGGAVANIAPDEEVAKSGSASMKITCNSPRTSNVYAKITTTVPMVQGKQYDVSVQVKADTCDNFKILMEDWTKQYSLTMFSQSYDWTNFEFTYTATKTGDAIVGFLAEGITEAWVDSFIIIDRETGKNLVENSEFETGNTVSELDVANGRVEDLYNNIKEADTFSQKDIESVRGAFKYMPVYAAENIVIDGNGDDWINYPAMSMPTLSTQYQVYIDDGLPKDVDAKAKFAQDDEALYLYLEVIDDIYVYEPGTGYWKGDSIQLAISTLEENYGSELGFTFNPQTGEGEIYGSGFSESQRNDMTLRASRSETTTIYEVKIPWTTKYVEKPDKFLFNFLINDNDGNGRRYCAQLAPGISEGKVNTEFPLLENLAGQKDWYAWIEGPRNVFTEEELVYSCYIVNGGADRSFTISSDSYTAPEVVKIPSATGVRKELKVTYDEAGEYKVGADISTGDDSIRFEIDVSAERTEPDAKYVEALAEKLKKCSNELKRLIERCEKEGMNPEYEIVNQSVIERFSKYVLEDLNNNDLYRIYYTEETCLKLYDEAKANLNAYLAGEKKPLNVPRYVTSGSKVDGQALYSMTELDGKAEERPVFFVGYGHFDEVRNDIPVFKNFGTNSIQQEISPMDCVTGLTPDEFKFNPEAAQVQKMLQTLEMCEKNNISISLLLSPHYMSEAVIKANDMEYSDHAFLKYNVNHPAARKFTEVFIKGFIPLVKDYQCIRNICLSNEPHFSSSNLPEFYTPMWHEWLAEKYNNDISALNARYGTEYTGFGEVDMVYDDTMQAKTYDYKLFNDEIFSDWHRFMAETVKEIAPDIPLQSKITGYTRSNKAYSGLIDGVGYERYSEFLDFNGCDFWNVMDDNQEPLVKEMWYDYMSSFKQVPIINSEDHHITDGSKDNYPLELADYVAQDVYMGAIHGRAESDLWVWARTTNRASGLRDSILYRPDAITTVGHASLDLNRLAYDIVALQEEPAEVGIVYSNSDMLFNDASMHAAYAAYEAVVFNGQKARFVLDMNPEAMNNYKMVIVPNTVYITDEMFDALVKYAENGGHILVMGTDCFAKDEQGFDRDKGTAEYLMNLSAVIDYVGGAESIGNMTKEELAAKIRTALIDAGAYYISVVNAETGEKAHNIEYNIGVNGDKVIINLSNLGEDAAVKIFAGDNQIMKAKELRSGEEMNEVFEVGQYQVITLETDLQNRFADTYGHWAEKDIAALADKNIINGISKSRYAPQGTTTRAEFLTLLINASGLSALTYSGKVTDVSGNDWFAPYVEAGVQAGIIPQGEAFRPNEAITREEMCGMLISCYEATKGMITADADISFSDADRITDSTAVAKAVSADLMFGMDDGRFAPENTATRAEAAAVISRYIK